MKPKFLLLLLPSLFCAVFVGTSQQPLPFGKKLPKPTVIARDEAMFEVNKTNQKELPYTSFDSESKQFTRHGPGQRPAQYPGPGMYETNAAGRNRRGHKSFSPAFRLTKDINDLSESYPENNPANAQYSFAVLNNVSYFFAEDGFHGRELWRSDGTAVGTYLVKDINPGEAGSAGSGIITANGLLYFSATTAETGYEPWVSDGTEAGTHLLKDLNPGIERSLPNQFVEVNGSVYFTTSLFGENAQLWKTDGTENGTFLVKDLLQAGIGHRIFELTGANNLVYFIAFTWNTGFQLFRSDGTEWGTYVAKEIGFNDDFNGTTAPSQLTEYNNKLYFSADDGTGRKLWTSDGSFDGTMPVPGDNGVLMQTDYTSIFQNFPFRILNNVLYIAGYTYFAGSGLYKYDASNAEGIVLVKDLTDLPDQPNDDVSDFVVPVDITLVNDKLYFKVISNIGGWHDELWVTNGETAYTQLVKVFGAGEEGVYTYNFYNGNGVLYFVVNNHPLFGNELWTSDGTTDGTRLVKDIHPGKYGSFATDLTFCNGKLLFRATTYTTGSELWSTNGAKGITLLVKDINTTTTNGSDAGYLYKGIGRTKNGVVFNAITPVLGAELYKSDGTTAGTVLLNDIATGEEWSYPNYYIFKNNVTYFIGDNANGTALYKTDGTTAGLKRITAYINRPQYYVVNYNVTDKGLAFYTLGSRSTGEMELWRSDGTDQGTFLLTTSLFFYYNNYIEVIDNTAFFIGGDFNTGYELWKSDGTVAGTQMVKDINPGAGGSDPYSFFVYKNKLYFGAYDGTSTDFHRSLWNSDGTKEGTFKLKDIEPTFYSPYFNREPQHVYCVSNRTLYFTATDYTTYGNELWKTKGIKEGIELVKDINPYSGSYPENLTDVKGTLFFTASDGDHGNELWLTNGTEKSTKLVKDVTPDFGSSFFTSLCSAGGKLYFLNATTSYPGKLWSSDGTAENTNEILDEVLADLDNISQLTCIGDKLFFGAYTYQYGTELYVGNASAKKFDARMVQLPASLDKSALALRLEEANLTFDASLYPNPARDKAIVQIYGDAMNANIAITDVSGKTIWQANTKDKNTIEIPIRNLTAGVYWVTLKIEKGVKTFKLVKQ